MIYEVKVKDEVEAKGMELNMKKETFKSTINNNIQAESPNLSATVENVENPTVKKRYKQNVGNANTFGRKSNTENDNHASTTDSNDEEEASPSSFTIVIILFVAAILFGSGFMIYNRKYKT